MDDNVRLITSLNAASQGVAEKYEPVMFGSGPWTEAEMAIVNRAFERFVPRRVSAAYNMWIVYKVHGMCLARPQTWAMAMSLKGENASELAEAICEYFGR